MLPLVQCPFLGWEVPHLHPIILPLVQGSYLEGGTPASLSWQEATSQSKSGPRSGQAVLPEGNPPSSSGPRSKWRGIQGSHPCPGQAQVRAGGTLGYSPIRTVCGYPLPHRDGMRVHPVSLRTCTTAGGMLLAFT